MNKLMRQQKRLIGVDIGEHEIRLMEVVREDQNARIEALAVQSAPDLVAMTADPTHLDAAAYIAAVGDAVRTAVQAAGTHTRQAVIAISGADILAHEIQVPADLKEQALEARVCAEAAAYFPLPLEEIALDFIVLTKAASDAPPSDYRSVLMIACPLALLEMRKSALAQGGLETVCVDVDLFALERSYAHLSQQLAGDGALAAVHLAAHAMKVYVASAGRIRLSAEVRLPEPQADPNLAPIKPASAVAEKPPASERGVNCFAPGQTNRLPEQFPDLTAQMRDCARTSGFQLKHILADGLAQNEPDLMRQIEMETGLQIPSLHPLAECNTACHLDQKLLRQKAPVLGIAHGLALRTGLRAL